MDLWENFEIKCTDYLNDKFGRYANFIHQGGPDSTIPDILVITNSGNTFYIDVKHSPAQCGQFVLLPNLDTKSFEYSSLNVNHINQYAKMIIEHMNNDFDGFREAGTAGKDINMTNGSDIFTNWIIQIYSAKGVEFFITNNYTILPISRFRDYFEVSAKYRTKRSGSDNVGKSKLKPVMEYINSHNYNITDFCVNGDKLFVTSPQQLHNQRFILEGNEFMFSRRDEKFEIRKLSNTHNANVIFSIKYKSFTPGITDDEFITYLK